MNECPSKVRASLKISPFTLKITNKLQLHIPSIPSSAVCKQCLPIAVSPSDIDVRI